MSVPPPKSHGQPTLASYGLAILVGCCLCASLLSSLL